MTTKREELNELVDEVLGEPTTRERMEWILERHGITTRPQASPNFIATQLELAAREIRELVDLEPSR